MSKWIVCFLLLGWWGFECLSVVGINWVMWLDMGFGWSIFRFFLCIGDYRVGREDE